MSQNDLVLSHSAAVSSSNLALTASPEVDVTASPVPAPSPVPTASPLPAESFLCHDAETAAAETPSQDQVSPTRTSLLSSCQGTGLGAEDEEDDFDDGQRIDETVVPQWSENPFISHDSEKGDENMRSVGRKEVKDEDDDGDDDWAAFGTVEKAAVAAEAGGVGGWAVEAEKTQADEWGTDADHEKWGEDDDWDDGEDDGEEWAAFGSQPVEIPALSKEEKNTGAFENLEDGEDGDGWADFAEPMETNANDEVISSSFVSLGLVVVNLCLGYFSPSFLCLVCFHIFPFLRSSFNFSTTSLS